MTAHQARAGRSGTAARSRVTLVASVLAASAAMLMLASCTSGAGTVRHNTSSYSVGHVQTLVVDVQVGDVQVTGISSATISVTEHVTTDTTAPVTTRRIAAGTLTLTSTCRPRPVCSVSYDISVPRATTVRVTDNVGTIRLDSLSGPVTALSDAGKIELGSLSGPVEATTHAGWIHGQDMSPAQATLHVSAGEIDVAFSAPPATVAATTDVGAITLRVPGSVPYRVDATATVGSIQVTVTRSPTATRQITASTDIGSVTIEPA